MKKKWGKWLSVCLAIYMFFLTPLQVWAADGSANTSKAEQKVVSVSLGYWHSAAITENGDLYCWGYNSDGQVGNGTKGYQYTPQKILEKVVNVSVRHQHSAAITENGDLYCWGWNAYGQVGNGTTENQHTLQKVLGKVKSVSLGCWHSAAITENGDLYCWGYNSDGQVGNGTTKNQLTPQKILGKVKSVSLGYYHSAAITENGDLYCWGSKAGNGTTEYQLTPQKILKKVKSVSLGNGNSAAITENGDLYCWGSNAYGQVGNGTSNVQYTPQKILEKVKSVSLGDYHSAAITENGDLYCWGSNVYGQVGNGTTENQLTPRKILGKIKVISVGDGRSAAVTENGDLYCWGYNFSGQVGNGTTEHQNTPQKVLEKVKNISMRGEHSAAITGNGELYCWGVNVYGQVGNGGNADQLTPTKISFGTAPTKNPVKAGEVKTASNHDLTFSVYDGAVSNLTTAVLSDAEITIDGVGTAKTDENGIAIIENTVKDTAVANKKITIQKSGYKDYIFYQDIYNKDITDWIVNPNKISVLMTPLKSGEDAFPYVSTVTLQAGTTVVRNTLDTSYTFDSRDSIHNGKIRINAVWNGKTPKSYRIYSEDGKKSYTSKDGIFEFDMLNAFSSGSPIWIELLASDGTGIKQKTRISIKQYSSQSSKNPTLTLAEAQTDTPVGNDKPLLSGESIDFKIQGIKMSASVSEGKVRIMLGAEKKLADGEVFSEKEWEEWKDACQLQPSDLNLTQWSNLMEAYDISTTSNATATAKIYGYLEGTWNNGGDTILSGTMKLDASMGVGIKAQYWVGGIPVYARVFLSEQSEAAGRIGYNWSKICVDQDTTDFTFTITPTLEGEGGVGVMAVATVGVSGKGTMPIKTNVKKVGKSDAVEVSLKAKMSIKASVLGFNYSLDMAEDTWQLYPEQKNKLYTQSMSLTDFEVADRSYINKDSKWTGGNASTIKAKNLGNNSSIEHILEKYIYPDTQIQMIETGQTRMLVWTEDDKTRENLDRSRLVYSVYNKSSGWSSPQAIADDGTADYSPKVVADDSHIYVAWQNNTNVYGKNGNLSDVAKETAICMSIWDDKNGNFSEAIQLSDGKMASYSPKIALDNNGNPYTIYVTNSKGNPFLTDGTNDLCYAAYDGSTVKNVVMVSNAGLLTSYSPKNGKLGEASYTVDTDGDYSTQDDRELYSVSNGKAVNISKNSGMDSNVQYVNWNGKAYRFWYASGSIVMEDDTGNQKVVYQDKTGVLSDEFSVIAGDDSQLAVVWTAADEQGNKQIQGVLYDKSGDNFTPIVQLSEIKGDVDQPSGVFLEDGSILFAYKKVINGETDLCTYQCVLSTDMAVENAYCDEEKLIPGQKASVNVEVKNDGQQKVDGFQIDIGGTKTQISEAIMPGESKIVTADYNVPAKLSYGSVNVKVEAAGDTDNTNNTCEMTIGYADVCVKVTDNNLEKGHIISVEASNDSYVNAQTKLNVYANGLDGKLLQSIDLGELQKGNVTTVDYIWNQSVEGYSQDISSLYFALETDTKERYTNNNYDFVAVGTGQTNEAPKEVKVESISLSGNNGPITNGNKLQLNATVKPDNAKNKKIVWSSDCPSVATVDRNGLVTAVSAGKATITVKAQDGSGVEASCIVEVTGASAGGNDSTGGGSSAGGGGTSNGSDSAGGNASTGGDSSNSGNGSNSTTNKPTIKVLYYVVNFDKNGGTSLSRQKMTLLQDQPLGILPKVVKKNYTFTGWYTQPKGGKKVNEQTVLGVSTSLFAHWKKVAKPSKGQISSLKSKKAGTMTVACKKQSKVKGYEIVYSTKKNFKKSATQKEAISSTNATIKGLKKGQTYYVKIHAYRIDSTGAKVYGKYSTMKTVKIKK